MLQWIKKYQTHIFKAAFLMGVLLGAAFLFVNDSALAQSIADPNSSINQGLKVIEQPLGLPATDIRVIIANIIKIALSLVGLVLVCLVIYAGYLWMTAGGNDEQIEKAKAMIKNAVIGLAIILSAYSIVAYILNLLNVGGGEGGAVSGGGQEQVGNFNGSGALGQIVKDHYPARNQANVYRNAKINITFRKPILLSDFVDDQNSNGILGDCKPNMTDWINDCDRIKTENGLLVDKFISIKRIDTGEFVPAAAITAVSSTDPITKISGIYTITIKPLPNVSDHPSGGYLGSEQEPLSYLVHLGGELRLDIPTNPKMFSAVGIGNDYYEWQYTYGTAMDTLPPHVVSVFPDKNQTEARNSVIQIDFNEAMDPSLIQGSFSSSGNNNTFVLSGGSVYLKSNNSTIPQGFFNLTNGYRTLEFTPSSVCGQNACGGTIYCLPVCDNNGANCQSDDYQILLKAAETISNASFEAKPYTGITDNSGNALDGNNNKLVEKSTNSGLVFDGWKKPDNDFWKFTLKNEIDATAPYLSNIKPGIDAQFIDANFPWEMTFSKRMRLDPMYGIKIIEKPAKAIPLCLVPSIIFGVSDTITKMQHCPFIDNVKQDYLPVLTSDLEDVHFNCFYPGKGPKETANADKVSADCQANGTGCCSVGPGVPFCCNGSATSYTTSTCLSNSFNIQK